MSLFVSIWVAVMLGWSAYRYGLFFDSDFYQLEVIIFACFIGWIFYQTVKGQAGIIPLWTLFPFGLAVLYAGELWNSPASVKGTIDAMLRWMAYGSWGLLLWGLWRRPESRAWGWITIQAAGFWLLAGGWAGWYGWTSFTDIVLRFNDAELSATGVRLAGFMQYPNGYGAVLAAFLLMQLQVWAGDGARSSRWHSCFAAATVIPYGGALLLTESRGAILALFLGFGLALWLHDRVGRRRLLVVSGIAAAGSALMAKAAWSSMLAMNATGGEAGYHGNGSGGIWLALLCAVAGTILFIHLSGYWDRQVDGGKQAANRAWAILPWVIAGCGTVIASWVTYGSMGERMASHYGTAASRTLFYADAWKMFKDSPWLGYGGESWRMLFGLYQSRPYVGNEVHSGYIEIALDVGLIGLALLLFMLSVFVVKMWRHNKQALAPAAVLLSHAAIDFDWSYGFVWLLLIAWVMLHIAPQEQARRQFQEGQDQQEQARKQLQEGQAQIIASARDCVENSTNSSLRYVAAERLKALARIGRAGIALLLLGSAAAGLWAAWRSDAAASARSDAASAASPVERAAKLRSALVANPAWNRIRLELAPLLPLQEQASLLEAGLRYEPQAPPLLLRLGIVHAELGDVAQARSHLREALRLERFSREGQTAAIVSLARLAELRQADGDVAQAREAAEAVVSFFERFDTLDHEVAMMRNPANGKRFQLTAAAKLHTAECLLLLSRGEEARSLLQEIVVEGDEEWKEQAQALLDKVSTL